jgi:hypothetical protein
MSMELRMTATVPFESPTSGSSGFARLTTVARLRETRTERTDGVEKALVML